LIHSILLALLLSNSLSHGVGAVLLHGDGCGRGL